MLDPGVAEVDLVFPCQLLVEVRHVGVKTVVAIARNTTSCTFIARSTAAFG